MRTDRSEGRLALHRFAGRLVAEFGTDTAMTVQRIMMEELGGLRITIPDLRQFERERLHARIRSEFNGVNCCELALRFGLSPRQIRRVVNH